MRSGNEEKTPVFLGHHEKLLTNSLRFDRQFAANDICVRCNRGREDVRHILITCPKAAKIWDFIVMPTELSRFLNLNSVNWLEDLIRVSFRNIVLPDCPWEIICFVSLWGIWKARNCKVFDDKEEPFQLTIRTIVRLAEEIKSAFYGSDKKKASIVRTVFGKSQIRVRLSLNTDGSYYNEKLSAAVGGLIRDEHGKWIMDFSMKLGYVTITVAELLGLREGLRLAWLRRFERIEVKLDSLIVYELVSKGSSEVHPLGLIVQDCRLLLQQSWEVRLSHMPNVMATMPRTFLPSLATILARFVLTGRMFPSI